MTIIIAGTSTQPLYEQIVAQIKSQIIDGTLEQGYALPSIRALAKDLSVSIITTKRAYEELEQQGYIQTAPGRGSFVSVQDRQRLVDMQLIEMEKLLEKAVEAGRSAGVGKAEMIKALEIIFDGE